MAVIARVLLVLLPFILFGIWLYWTQSRQKAGRPVSATETRRFLLVSSLSMALAFAGLVFWGFGRGSNAGDIYIPAKTVDGKVIPGRFITPEEAAKLGIPTSE